MSSFHQQIPKPLQIKGAAIFLLRHLFKKDSFLREAQRENAQEIQHYLRQNTVGEVLPVSRIKNLDQENFLKHYLKPGLPVIFSQEALNWESSQKWNFDFLAQQFGEQEYSVLNINGLSEKGDSSSKHHKVILKEYIQSLKKQTTQDYLRFCPLIEVNSQLAKDLDQKWLQQMQQCFFGISYQSFLGPRGKKTPLHSDTTAFFYIMSQGRKKWTLFSPTALALLNPEAEGKGYNFTHLDLTKVPDENYPGCELISRYECVLEKGDILFVPAWMWHQVENLTDSFGVSYRFTNLRGFWQFPFYAFLRVFFTSPNFLQVIYYSFFKNDLHQRDKFLLSPKIILKK